MLAVLCLAGPAVADFRGPSWQRLLAYYDAHFDADEQLLALPQASPGYHSRLPDGAQTHPVRESFYYVIALLQRGAAADIRRAETILRRVLPMQERRRTSRSFGIWPWYAEEPLDAMPAVDPNWADFCGMALAHVLVAHEDLLPADVAAESRIALACAARAIKRRDVGPAYTNIAVLGGGVCVVAGEVLGDSVLRAYGRQRLEDVLQHSEVHGGFSEYNSPPYAKVVIGECDRLAYLARDPAARRAAERIRRLAWQMVADSFHPGTSQWAGPHSRTSRTRMRGTLAAFLSMRIGRELPVHPTMQHEPPRGYAVVPPQPCPDELLSKFTNAKSSGQQLRRTYRRSSRPEHERIGTTWFTPQACLGSINRSSFWTQRKPIIGYWHTAEDPAVMFRVRFLHDGRDFASAGLIARQVGQRIVFAIHTLAGRGDWHRSLDRPAGGILSCRDLRLRCELDGRGVAVQREGTNFALRAGHWTMRIVPAAGNFAGRELSWELGQTRTAAYVDAVCYAGARKDFDFSAPLPMRLAAGIELLRDGQAPTAVVPRWAREGKVQQLEWRIKGTPSLRLP